MMSTPHPPLFAGRVAVDIFYEKAAVFSGHPIRCYAELRPPSDCSLEEPAHLVLLTVQAVGVVTAINASYKPQLQALSNASAGDKDGTDRAFENAVIEDAEERLRAVASSTVTKGLTTTSQQTRRAVSQKATPKPPPPQRPSHPRSASPSPPDFPDFCFSPPTVLCKNEVFSDASTVVTLGFELLLPPHLPPTYSGSFFRYWYALSLVAVRKAGGAPLHVYLPLLLVGPVESALDLRIPRPIVDARFCLPACPKAYRIHHLDQGVDIFSFGALSWRNGACDCQYGYCPPMTSPCGISTLLTKETLSDVETAYLLFHLGNSSAATEDPEDAYKSCGPSAPLRRKEAEIFRISQGQQRIATVQFLQLHENLTTAASDISNLAFPEPFAGVHRPRHAIIAICGRPILARLDFKDATIDTYEVHAHLVREEIVRQTQTTPFAFNLFGFGTETATTTTTASPGINRYDYTARRVVCAETKHVVFQKEQETLQLDIPQVTTRSFLTELVMVRYSVVFHFFCSNTPRKMLEADVFDVLRLDAITELSWSVGLIVFPSPSDGSNAIDAVVPRVDRDTELKYCMPCEDPPNAPRIRYSPVGTCWHLGDAHKRVYRGVLL